MNTSIMQVPCEIDRDHLIKRLHLKPNSSHMKRVDQWIEEALRVGKPKVAYRMVKIDEKGDDFIVIENKKFTSKVLRINFEEVDETVVFVITSGVELEDWSSSFTNSFELLCTDGIKEEALRCANLRVFPQIKKEFNMEHCSEMHPGSLPNWPLKEQQPLFQLLGDVKALIGVELSESFLMSPIKTESGLFFASESNYANCQICLHEDCPDRRAPFDNDLYKNKYQLEEESIPV